MPAHKNEFRKKTKQLGFNNKKLFPKIGFVLDNLSPGQIPYMCVSHCNEFVSNNIGLNLAIFFVNHGTPCVNPLFARHHVRDAQGFYGHLVSTSVITCVATKDCATSRRYFYIQDPMWLRSNDPQQLAIINEIMLNDKITKVFRCEDHFGLAKAKWPALPKIVIKDFDIHSFLELINGKQG